MKKIILSLLIGGTFFGYSQETTIGDALRYSIEDLNGSARFRALSGSMGAIGGDLSAIIVNPAGSVVFKYNTFSATMSGFNKKNNASYFGSSSSDNDFKLDINQIGAVFVFENTDEKSKWEKMSIGVNYENTNNFNNQLFLKGTNPYNSIGDYFLNAAQNVPFDVIDSYSFDQLYFNEQQAYLGYNTYIIEYDSTNDSYYSNIPEGGNFLQQKYTRSKGYNGKLTGNFAANYDDVFSFGMNLNIHFTDYNTSSVLTERNNNDLYSSGYTIKSIQFENDLYTYGRGFSFNLGTIAKVTEAFRVGLAYESPTWYTMNDELTQRIYTNYADVNGGYSANFNPSLVNLYPSYTIQTPSKWTGSAAYIFGSNGFLNVDISSKDYANTKFKPKNDAVFSNLNSDMNTNLKNTISYNIGGEYKINQVSLRAGYRFEESPYKVDQAMGDLIGYSGGLGYSFNNARVDLSYANTHRNYNQSLISSGMTDQARINNVNDNFSLSYTVTF